MALPPDQPQFYSVFTRYSILPHSDVERCFSIEPEDGTIRTAVPLDREARVWHNLTVLATELGEESWAPGGPGEGSSLLAEGLSLSVGAGGRKGTAIGPSPVYWVPSLDHHHQAGLLS